MATVPPPPPPTPAAGLPAAEQARVLLRDYTDALQWGAEASRLHRELIDWVNRLLHQNHEDTH